MNNYFKIGSFLFMIYAIILVYLVVTAFEMEILLAINFGLIGLVVLLCYFLLGFIYIKVRSSRRIMWVILGIILVYGVYFVIINLTNSSGAPRWL